MLTIEKATANIVLSAVCPSYTHSSLFDQALPEVYTGRRLPASASPVVILRESRRVGTTE
jgi:hypothetical protein